ncbi:hypothetical protein OSTOST_25637, partial [Ostertagia ostertagi]
MDCVLALLKGGAALKRCKRYEEDMLTIAEYLRSQGALLFIELSETAARVIQSWWRAVLLRRRFRKIRL